MFLRIINTNIIHMPPCLSQVVEINVSNVKKESWLSMVVQLSYADSPGWQRSAPGWKGA